MPRRSRIDLAGFHHVINRCVNRLNIFVDAQDYEMFLKILFSSPSSSLGDAYLKLCIK